jgi:hypothetical protein
VTGPAGARAVVGVSEPAGTRAVVEVSGPAGTRAVVEVSGPAGARAVVEVSGPAGARAVGVMTGSLLLLSSPLGAVTGPAGTRTVGSGDEEIARRVYFCIFDFRDPLYPAVVHFGALIGASSSPTAGRAS